MNLKHYIVLSAVVICLFLLPFLLFPNIEWGGTDTAAGNIVTDQGYQPWLTPAWTPPGNIEGWLFGLQASIGVLIACFFVIHEVRRRVRIEKTSSNSKQGASDAEHSHLSAEIDTLAHTNGLAKTSPIAKMLFAASALLFSVLSPNPLIPLIVFTTTTFLLISYARIQTRFYLELLLYPTLIVAISSLLIALFFGYGQPLVQLPLPWFQWIIFENGVSTAIATFFRVEGALAATYFLILTTSMTNIFVVLRKIRFPRIFIELSLLVYRYIFVFAETTAKMNRAQKLRLGQSSLKKRISGTALIAGSLFIRTLDQGERTLTAMNARGYDGNIRILEDIGKPSKTALAGIAIFNMTLTLTAYLLTYFGV